MKRKSEGLKGGGGSLSRGSRLGKITNHRSWKSKLHFPESRIKASNILLLSCYWPKKRGKGVSEESNIAKKGERKIKKSLCYVIVSCIVGDDVSR